MTRQASELLQKALSLSDEERAELAGSLIESLDLCLSRASGGHQVVAIAHTRRKPSYCKQRG